jgi:hypothetical protein
MGRPTHPGASIRKLSSNILACPTSGGRAPGGSRAFGVPAARTGPRWIPFRPPLNAMFSKGPDLRPSVMVVLQTVTPTEVMPFVIAATDRFAVPEEIVRRLVRREGAG